MFDPRMFNFMPMSNLIALRNSLAGQHPGAGVPDVNPTPHVMDAGPTMFSPRMQLQGAPMQMQGGAPRPFSSLGMPQLRQVL